MVTVREIDTNITRETVTDREGRFRFTYLKVGRYEINVRLQGFADANRTLTLTLGVGVRSADPLTIASVDTQRDRHRRCDGA